MRRNARVCEIARIGATWASSVWLVGAALLTPLTALADSFTVLHSFDTADGNFVPNPLTEGHDGLFYGTAATAGINYGTAFAISKTGTFQLLHTFDQVDGEEPSALTLFHDGNFYGSTIGSSSASGQILGGTLFKMTPDGTLSVLHQFAEHGKPGGSQPGALVDGGDGYMYGPTTGFGLGTIFRLSPNGSFATTHRFQWPAISGKGLIRARDGGFYGTLGQSSDICQGCTVGAIFKMTETGTVTVLHVFDTTDGALPNWNMVEMPAGTLYGTTSKGGTNGAGTMFRVTSDGVFTTLYAFDAASGGSYGGLTLGPDGNFYGTTYGVPYSGGTIFRMTPIGELTTLHSFSGADGENPLSPPIVGSDGWLYGTAARGGSEPGQGGTIYKFNGISATAAAP